MARKREGAGARGSGGSGEVRRGAAFRRVRARTLRNEESKMCHTSRVAWYKLTSARVCFGAALCFGFLFVPNGGPARRWLWFTELLQQYRVAHRVVTQKPCCYAYNPVGNNPVPPCCSFPIELLPFSLRRRPPRHLASRHHPLHSRWRAPSCAYSSTCFYFAHALLLWA